MLDTFYEDNFSLSDRRKAISRGVKPIRPLIRRSCENNRRRRGVSDKMRQEPSIICQ